MIPVKLSFLMKGIADYKGEDIVIRDIVTDSRAPTPDSLYVAIVGDRYDGNDFTREALEKGAAAALVSSITPNCTGIQIPVEDTRKAYVAMSGAYRDMFSLKTVGITGSVGKTTVKEMLYSMLPPDKTLKTPGNRNNAIGLPGTLFTLDEGVEYGIFEMGMSNRGEIDILSRAVKPDVAVITCIGVSHIEYLGTRENILKAKLEITAGMGDNGILVYNSDDDMLASEAPMVPLITVSYGIDSDACVRASDIVTNGNTTLFTIIDRDNGTFSAELPSMGRHNVLNALAAYTAATRLGVEPMYAVESLKKYVPCGMRQNIVERDGIILIEDCYNAAPESMKASLRTLTDVVQRGLKIAVLGDMLELGELSDEAHREIGREAGRLGIDIVLCCGEHSKLIAEAATASGVTVVKHFTDRIALADYLNMTAKEGDGILFKASRAMQFERIIENFRKEDGDIH